MTDKSETTAGGGRIGRTTGGKITRKKRASSNSNYNTARQKIKGSNAVALALGLYTPFDADLSRAIDRAAVNVEEAEDERERARARLAQLERLIPSDEGKS